MAPFLARMSAAAGGAFRFCVVPSTAVSDCNVMTAVRSLDLATARSCTRRCRGYPGYLVYTRL